MTETKLRQDIIKRVKHLESLESVRDIEYVHEEADGELEEVLLLIKETYDIPEIDSLIAAYDRLEKWYA